STFSITLSLPVAETLETHIPGQYETADVVSVRSLARGAAEADVPVILVVDDHPTNRKLLALQIELFGLRTVIAESGDEALPLWRNGRFAIIITDCHMPEMDGYTLTHEIRKIEAGEARPHTPIIAWTANALPEEVGICLAAGMDEVLVKPVDLTQLERMLLKWLPAAEAAEKTDAGPHVTDKADAPIDYAALTKIVAGRADQIKVLRDFRSIVDEDRAKLAEALANGERVSVERFAHRMQGASRMVGAKELADACAAIEQYARRGDLDGAQAAKPDLDKAIQRLEIHFAELKGSAAIKPDGENR
ncbi:MAG: response regulator, partial [Gallionella sp.]